MSKTFARALVAAVAMTLVASTSSAVAASPPGGAGTPSVPPAEGRGATALPASSELAEPGAAPPSGRAPEPPARSDGRVPVDPVAAPTSAPPDGRVPVDPGAPPSLRPDGRVPIDPVAPPTSAPPDGRVPVEAPAAPPPVDGVGEPATPPDPVPSPDGAPTPVPAAEAPTDSLRRLAASMVVAHNSLTVQISFPPMSGITPTEISIGFSGPRTTQDYNGAFGFRYAYNYPLTDAGATQRAHFSVTLTEKIPGGQRFAIDAYRDLEPVFDVALGTLILSQTGDCDLGEWLDNVADPFVAWRDPFGNFKNDDHPSYLGDHRHEIRGFAGTFRGIRLSPAFTLPGLAWAEEDFLSFDAASADRGGALLPGVSRRVEAHQQEDGGDCSGLFSYDITYTPWTWASLNPHIRAPQ